MKCVINTKTLNNNLLSWCAKSGIQVETNAIMAYDGGFDDGQTCPASVYFVSDGEYVKIGRTGGLRENVMRRIKQFATGNPRPMSALIILETNYGAARWLENALHEMFRDRRVKNEWFDILNDVIDADGAIPAVSRYYLNPAGAYTTEEIYGKEENDGAA